jgi:molybdopterin-guanine dinucleotide biosynthesis protein A
MSSNSHIIPRTAGIVLCGGRSSRMGRPKAWLPFAGETLLQRTVRTLQHVVEPVVVVAAPNQDLPRLPEKALVVRDDREFLGPLNGLATGLVFLKEKADAAYLSSCDVPFLRPGFVRRVIERMGDVEICMPNVGEFPHPVAACYRVSVLPAVRSLLDANRLRPIFLAETCATRFLYETDLTDVDPQLQSLRNVNSPEEYQQALFDAAQAPAGPE